MPLQAFISLSINYLKNICSCDEDKVLTVWCIHEGTYHYRAQFLVLGTDDRRYFDVCYQENGDVFTFQEIKVKSRKDIPRGKLSGSF